MLFITVGELGKRDNLFWFCGESIGLNARSIERMWLDYSLLGVMRLEDWWMRGVGFENGPVGFHNREMEFWGWRLGVEEDGWRGNDSWWMGDEGRLVGHEGWLIVLDEGRWWVVDKLRGWEAMSHTVAAVVVLGCVGAEPSVGVRIGFAPSVANSLRAVGYPITVPPAIAALCQHRIWQKVIYC